MGSRALAESLAEGHRSAEAFRLRNHQAAKLQNLLELQLPEPLSLEEVSRLVPLSPSASQSSEATRPAAACLPRHQVATICNKHALSTVVPSEHNAE